MLSLDLLQGMVMVAVPPVRRGTRMPGSTLVWADWAATSWEEVGWLKSA